jgi:hypothetical protein
LALGAVFLRRPGNCWRPATPPPEGTPPVALGAPPVALPCAPPDALPPDAAGAVPPEVAGTLPLPAVEAPPLLPPVPPSSPSSPSSPPQAVIASVTPSATLPTIPNHDLDLTGRFIETSDVAEDCHASRAESR